MAFGNNQQVISATTSSGVTISSYVVPSGDNKILLVHVGVERSSGAPVIDTPTFNSSNMIQRTSITQSFDINQQLTSEIWDYLLGSTTPTGDIVCTSSGISQGFNVLAHTGIGLKQQAPEATASSIANSTDPHSTNITTVTVNAEIADCMQVERNTGTFTTTNASQTAMTVPTPQKGTNLSSHLTATSISTYSLGWDDSADRSCDWAHTIVAYAIFVASSLEPSSLTLLGVGK